MTNRVASSILNATSGAVVALVMAAAGGDAQAVGAQVLPGVKPEAARAALAPAASDRTLRPAYPHIFPADSDPYGLSYADWGVQGLQGYFSMPVAAKVDDGSAATCMIGQRGPVWVPIVGVPHVACALPADRSLSLGFYQVNFNTPDLCGQVGSFTARELREQLAVNIDAATIAITIDGASVPNVANRFRFRSPVFSVTLPADNMVNQYCVGLSPIPAGVYSPAIADGFIVILRPLSVGRHQMKVHVEIPAQGWNFDTDYDIEVVPVARH